MSKPEQHFTLEERSKRLFSSVHRLPVFGAVGRYRIEPPELFDIPQLSSDIREARDTVIANRAILQQVETLVTLEMAVAHPPNDTMQKPYARLESSIWPPLLRLIEQWSGPPERQLNMFDDLQ